MKKSNEHRSSGHQIPQQDFISLDLQKSLSFFYFVLHEKHYPSLVTLLTPPPEKTYKDRTTDMILSLGGQRIVKLPVLKNR